MRRPRLASSLLLAGALGLGAQPVVAQDPAPVPPPSKGQGPAQKPKPQDAPVAIPIDVEAEKRGLPIRQFTLEEALRVGRANNVELRAAELVPQQATQRLLEAEAFFLPELYGDVGYGENNSPTRNAFSPEVKSVSADATMGWRQRVATGGLFDLAYQPAKIRTSGSSSFFPELYTSVWTATYTQPLLRGAGTDYNLAAVDSARHAKSGAEQAFARQVQDTLFAIVTAYWELAFARDNYRVVGEALLVAREQLRITEERIRVQELAPRDRIADEAEVARRQEELIIAENLIRAREDDLRRLLLGGQQEQVWHYNLRPTSELTVEPPEKLPVFEECAKVAWEQRPDLKALRSEVSVAEVNLTVADRDVLPGLDLVGSYGSDGAEDTFMSAWDDALGQEYPDWGLRLQFSIPIGNQAARARRQAASLELERVRRNLYAAMLDVDKQVRDAVRQLETLTQSIAASRVSVRLAESNLETEQVKLRVGSSTVFEVQRRNQELREARSRLLRYQVDFHVANGRLDYAKGTLRVAPQ
ncbi:MAG: hypothetical protein RL148_2363 [Planctomycetota bacterium]